MSHVLFALYLNIFTFIKLFKISTALYSLTESEEMIPKLALLCSFVI